jgi:hypothetical protein
MRYLMDENLGPIYKTQLLMRMPELRVFAVGDPGTPAKGTPDPEIPYWCEEMRTVLVTNNRKSMPVHLKDHLTEGRHILGILVLKETMGVGETIDELILIAETSFENEYQDRIEYLPLSY